MSEDLKNVAIKSVEKLLEIEMKLNIPEYQRPYKWSKRNILELLSDIDNAIEKSKTLDNFKYRIGTIILHKNGEKLDIVDGQQRIISLVLLSLFLFGDKFTCEILNHEFNNNITRYNIKNNYICIKDWFDSRSDETKKEFIDAFKNILEVVIISVTEISEAFQLFDSQNARGKSLAPHDLLKAYHLREMKESKYEIERAVVMWENKDSNDIQNLFDKFLFPIWNWSKREKSYTFTTKDIDIYKGVRESLDYSYIKRASKAMPYYQLTEPFISGKDFFQLVDHYLNLKEDIKKELNNVELNGEKISEIINDLKHYGSGFEYTKNLFYCAVLFYYDKFHNLDSTVIKKLFKWAFMLRVDMIKIGFDTINKYALGDMNNNYTNHIAIFSLIKNARLHSEIADIQVNLNRTDGKVRSDKWQYLYKYFE